MPGNTHPLSRKRCFILLTLFLLADSLNTDWQPGGRLTWLLCPLAGLLGGLFCRACIRLFAAPPQKPGRLDRSVCVLWLLLAVLSLGWMLGNFGLFVTTCNDFVRRPAGIVVMTAAVALYIACLPGHGLRRTAELCFPWILAFLLLSFTSSLGGWDLRRLLPIGPADPAAVLGGLWALLIRPFSQSFMAVALLSREAEPEALRAASRDASLTAGLILGLHHAKSTALVGFALASRYHFPVYALAGLRRSGSGSHIEDLLICALLAARLMKGAMLLRFSGLCLERAAGGRLRRNACTVLAALPAFWLGCGWCMTDAGAAAWDRYSLWPLALLGFVLPLGLWLRMEKKQKKRRAAP